MLFKPLLYNKLQGHSYVSKKVKWSMFGAYHYWLTKLTSNKVTLLVGKVHKQ